MRKPSHPLDKKHESTYAEFVADPVQKRLLDKDYQELLLSEWLLKKGLDKLERQSRSEYNLSDKDEDLFEGT